MSGFDLKSFADFAIGVLAQSSTYLRKVYYQFQHVGEQLGQDVETDADQYVASLWRNKLQEAFPSLSIDTEESIGRVNGNGHATVRIDSIDGSKHFMAGIPVFGTNISLETRTGEVLFAACDFPLLHECFYALKGHGAFFNGKRLESVSNDILARSFIIIEGPTSALFHENPELFEAATSIRAELSRHCFRIRDFGLAGFGLCMTASGACAGYVDLSGTTKIYDVQAGALLVTETGGTFTHYGFPGVVSNDLKNFRKMITVAAKSNIEPQISLILRNAGCSDIKPG